MSQILRRLSSRFSKRKDNESQSSKSLTSQHVLKRVSIGSAYETNQDNSTCKRRKLRGWASVARFASTILSPRHSKRVRDSLKAQKSQSGCAISDEKRKGVKTRRRAMSSSSGYSLTSSASSTGSASVSKFEQTGSTSRKRRWERRECNRRLDSILEGNTSGTLAPDYNSTFSDSSTPCQRSPTDNDVKMKNYSPPHTVSRKQYQRQQQCLTDSEIDDTIEVEDHTDIEEQQSQIKITYISCPFKTPKSLQEQDSKTAPKYELPPVTSASNRHRSPGCTQKSDGDAVFTSMNQKQSYFSSANKDMSPFKYWSPMSQEPISGDHSHNDTTRCTDAPPVSQETYEQLTSGSMFCEQTVQTRTNCNIPSHSSSDHDRLPSEKRKTVGPSSIMSQHHSRTLHRPPAILSSTTICHTPLSPALNRSRPINCSIDDSMIGLKSIQDPEVKNTPLPSTNPETGLHRSRSLSDLDQYERYYNFLLHRDKGKNPYYILAVFLQQLVAFQRKISTKLYFHPAPVKSKWSKSTSRSQSQNTKTNSEYCASPSQSSESVPHVPITRSSNYASNLKYFHRKTSVKVPGSSPLESPPSPINQSSKSSRSGRFHQTIIGESFNDDTSNQVSENVSRMSTLVSPTPYQSQLKEAGRPFFESVYSPVSAPVSPTESVADNATYNVDNNWLTSTINSSSNYFPEISE